MSTAACSVVEHDEGILDPHSLSIGQLRDLKGILDNALEYVPNSLFQSPEIMGEIVTQKVVGSLGSILKAGEERTLFIQMNYARFNVQRLRAVLLGPGRWQSSDIAECLEWNQLYLDTRNTLVSGNMGLVLSLAKRMAGSGPEYSDRVSEGNLALLRAIHGYDCSFGFRFSTYAHRVILLSLIQLSHRWHRHHRMFPFPWDPEMESDVHSRSEKDANPHAPIQDILDLLNHPSGVVSNLEKRIVEARYCLGTNKSKPMTLKQVGDQFGLSVGRIRRTLNQALAKLRNAALYPETQPSFFPEEACRLG
jgi:RNA polymerase sigma factor (sigma-70 family)